MHRYDVLGPLRVDGDEDAAPSRPAQRRLLSLLLLERRGFVPRDVLIDRMWPDGPPAQAVNTLQVHVSGVRRLLGGDAIRTDPRGYQLVTTPLDVDADRFATFVTTARAARTAQDHEAALAACEAASALWRGVPYPDLADDGWAVPEVDRLVEAHTSVRSLRAALHLDLGRWHEATEELEQLLVAHPHHERLWELLMLARYRAGRSADALQAYQRARVALGELGLDPGLTLRELEHRMLVQDPSLLGPTASGDGLEAVRARADAGIHAWPLLDRDDELARVDEVLEGRRLGLLLVGPPGVGKSRLLHEATRRADPATPVIPVRANASLRTVPLGPVSDLVRLAPGPVATQLDQLLEALRTLAADGAPPVLLVDDAHHLDDTTLALITRALATGAARVVATLRSDLPTPPDVTSWWKDAGLDRRTVAPLESAAFGHLLDRVLGPTAAATHQRIVDVAAGNPLHLRELVRAARDEGALVHESGRWRLVRPVVGAGRLGELVDLALRGLSRRSRTGLEVLALLRPAPRTVVDAVAGAGAVDDLQHAGLVQLLRGADDQLAVDAAHPLYTENLASRMPTERRHELARRVVGALAHGPRDLPRGVLPIALLALEVDLLDGELALRAAREALVRLDPGLARRLAGVAIDAGADAEGWLLLGRAAALAGDHADAERAFLEAGRRASPDRLVEIDSQRAATLALTRRDPAGAVAVLDDAMRCHPADTAAMARLRVDRALYLAVAGRMAEVVDEVEALAAQPLPSPVRLGMGIADTLARAMLGRVADLEERLDQLDMLAAELPDPPPLAQDQLAFNRVQGLLVAGRLEPARTVLRAWGERVERGEALVGLWLQGRMLLLDLTGEVGQAIALDRDTHEAFLASPDPFRLQANQPSLRAIALAQGGRLAEARAALAEVDDVALHQDARSLTLWRTARAWTWAEDPPRAAAGFAEAGRLAVQQGHPAWGVHAWYGSVRMGRADLAQPALEAVHATMKAASTVTALVEGARAHVDGAPHALTVAATRFEALGARLLAAETHAEAARRAAERGAPEVAEHARAQVARLVDRLGARTPALRP